MKSAFFKYQKVDYLTATTLSFAMPWIKSHFSIILILDVNMELLTCIHYLTKTMWTPNSYTHMCLHFILKP